MELSLWKGRSYFSQTPEIFTRRLKLQDVLFSSDIHPVSTLTSPSNQEFYAYWQELAQLEGGIPSRKSFNPSAARRVLPYISLIEKIGDDFRIRLTGTETDRVLGFVACGRMISELDHELAQKWSTIYRLLGDGKPALYRSPALCAKVFGLEMETVSVPFLHHKDQDPNGPSLIMTTFDICASD